jgi:hypothetical protein
MKIKEESEQQIEYIRQSHIQETEQLSQLIDQKESEKVDLKHQFERDILVYKEQMGFQVTNIQGSMENNMK